MALLLAAGAVGISLAASAQKQQPGAIAPPPRAELGPQRRRISLREALQLAAKQSPDIAAARATAAITEASVRRAWTTWQPDISATGTFDHTSAPSSIAAGTLGPGSPEIVLVVPNSRYATFQISQPFLSPQGLFQPGVATRNCSASNVR